MRSRAPPAGGLWTRPNGPDNVWRRADGWTIRECIVQDADTAWSAVWRPDGTVLTERVPTRSDNLYPLLFPAMVNAAAYVDVHYPPAPPLQPLLDALDWVDG